MKLLLCLFVATCALRGACCGQHFDDRGAVVSARPEDVRTASKVTDCLRGTLTSDGTRHAQHPADAHPDGDPVLLDVFRAAAKMSDCLRKAFVDDDDHHHHHDHQPPSAGRRKPDRRKKKPAGWQQPHDQ